MLEQCVSVIHEDIIEIWNIYDSSSVRLPQSTGSLSDLSEVSWRRRLQGQGVSSG